MLAEKVNNKTGVKSKKRLDGQLTTKKGLDGQFFHFLDNKNTKVEKQLEL
jgi:hypothetical protein